MRQFRRLVSTDAAAHAAAAAAAGHWSVSDDIANSCCSAAADTVDYFTSRRLFGRLVDRSTYSS